MMNEREKKIELYMKNLDISREEAIQLIEDDENDEIGEEGEAMTEKAKEVKRYEKSTKERKKVVKERKVDEEKARILEHLMEAIAVETKIDSVKNEAEFSFTYHGNAYTVKLVKHRPPKA
jgi:hypothetical protein